MFSRALQTSWQPVFETVPEYFHTKVFEQTQASSHDPVAERTRRVHGATCAVRFACLVCATFHKAKILLLYKYYIFQFQVRKVYSVSVLGGEVGERHTWAVEAYIVSTSRVQAGFLNGGSSKNHISLFLCDERERS